MPLSRTDRCCFMPGTACLTSPPPRRRTFFLPRQAKVRYILETLISLLIVRDLVTYCENENVPFTTFETFADILATVKQIVAGELDVNAAATGRK